jgi:hypothetical protein
VFTGSCTAASNYWSSTTLANFRVSAWFVGFNIGFVGAGFKDNTFHVRAVRGGL